MSQRYWHFVIAIVLFVSLVTSAYAGEVRIIDERGLIKAAKRTHSPATVTVQLGGKASAVPVLSNADGLHPEIQGQLDGSGKVVFRDVNEGTWKIKWIGSPLRLGTISIGEN